MKKYWNRIIETVRKLAEQVKAHVDAGKLVSEAKKMAAEAGKRLAAVKERIPEVQQWVPAAKKWASVALDRMKAAAKKPPKVKNILLQTYVTSLLSLALCVSMFLGTSFAWFTSEVESTDNEIYIGILEVDLAKQDKANPGSWLSLTEADNKLYAGGIFWEPGYTALETIRVTNEGDLAFKYVLNFTEGEIEVDQTKVQNVQSLETVAQFFDVWVHTGAIATEDYPKNYGDINTDNGWENVGTLKDLLAGKAVLDGSMDEPTPTGENSDTYIIALHMNEAANESVMGHKIQLNVKLVAYQASAEQDGFGNGYYDEAANAVPVSSLDELKTALKEENAEVALTEDISAMTGDIVVSGGTLYGNGNTVIASGNSRLTAITTTGGTIKNVVIDCSGKTVQGIGAGMTMDNPLSTDLYIDRATVYAAYYSVMGTANNVKIVVTNSDLYGGISYPGASLIEVSDTNFKYDVSKGAGQFTVNEIYSDTTFTNCTFADGYCVNAGTTGKTVRFYNCSVNGVKLTAENFKDLLIDDKYDAPESASSTKMKDCTIHVDDTEVIW